MLHRQPSPAGAHAEAFVLDDRVALCSAPPGVPSEDLAPAASFERGGRLLQDAGLHVHPRKALRGALHAKPLGIALRGDLPQGEVPFLL